MIALYLVPALYVVIPALVALAMVAYASWCPVVIEEEHAMVKQAVYQQVAAVVERRAVQASQAATYWERAMQLAVTHDARSRARAYAKMWRNEWRELSERACRYKEESVG